MNHLRRTILIILILSAVISAGPFARGDARPAQASGSWSAWLYGAEGGRLIQVFPDGAPAITKTLPLPAGVSSAPFGVTVSRDGTLLAACMIDDASNTSVHVYDLNAGIYRAAYLAPGGPTVGCTLGRYAFSEDGSLLAFGLLNSYPGMSDARPAWELLVMQVSTGSIVYRLDANAPAVVALGIDPAGKMPMLETFEQPTATRPGLITFKPVQWGTEGFCEYDGLVWNLTDGSVYNIARYGKNGLDVLLPNSELTWVETNPAYAQGVLEGPGCTHNMVMYSNKAGDLYPLFTNGTVVFGAEFVDDGRRIAFGTYTAGSVNQWYAMDRAGGLTALPADLVNTYEVWGTPDGYVFMTSGPDVPQEVRYHRFSGGPSPEVFTALAVPSNDYYRIIYVTPLAGGAGLPAFSPMPVVGPPPPPITPTLPPDVLVIGGRAAVNTTAGDVLRVRTGPGTTYPVSFQLAHGTPVTLVEGPAAGPEGYTWWRIRTDDGRSGWAVEGVPEAGGFLQTLIPLR
ncbi:MAG: SH3 domain-containing protein [Anaerolineae bacterium]|nr:SH3 domain-containing protein [Anaerolineae bacterium]